MLKIPSRVKIYWIKFTLIGDAVYAERIKELTGKYLPMILPEHNSQYGTTAQSKIRIIDRVHESSGSKNLLRIEYIIEAHKYTAFVDSQTNMVVGKIQEAPL